MVFYFIFIFQSFFVIIMISTHFGDYDFRAIHLSLSLFDVFMWFRDSHHFRFLFFSVNMFKSQRLDVYIQFCSFFFSLFHQKCVIFHSPHELMCYAIIDWQPDALIKFEKSRSIVHIVLQQTPAKLSKDTQNSIIHRLCSLCISFSFSFDFVFIIILIFIIKFLTILFRTCFLHFN